MEAVTFKARSQNFEKRLLVSSCSSVCLSAWNNSAPTGRIYWDFIFETFSKPCRENSGFIKITNSVVFGQIIIISAKLLQKHNTMSRVQFFII